jgi:hypothetical protein
MKQCKPGFVGCKYRGNSIKWIDLKEKCQVLKGNKEGVKDVKKL